MKIDPTQTTNLLDRMREAARSDRPQAATPGVDVSEIDLSAASVESTQLETDVRLTAERALRGEFQSADEVRREVVEQILRQRWTDRVAPEKLAQMVEELGTTLADDPEFRRSIDEMLVLASRQVGSP